MFCGSCGKQIPDGSGFCPSCGAAAGSGAPRPAANAGASTGPSAAAAQRAKIEAQFKAGSQDAIQAFMVLLKDPVGGLAKSYGLFDEGRALMVGGIFGVVFALVLMLAALSGGGGGLGMMMGGAGGGDTAALIAAARAAGYGPSTAKVMFQALIGGLVFAAVLMGVCVLVRVVFKGTSKLAGEIYTAGACLLPLALGVAVTLILGMVGLYRIIPAVLVFAGAYMILMLFAGFQRIVGISEGKAALAVPCALVIAGLVMGLIGSAF
ncbi:MAG TPA: zinc ribbon domain-containing protein [Candidatus Angelobacter sp.]